MENSQIHQNLTEKEIRDFLAIQILQANKDRFDNGNSIRENFNSTESDIFYKQQLIIIDKQKA